jgi:hypothetical protein
MEYIPTCIDTLVQVVTDGEGLLPFLPPNCGHRVARR